MVRAKVGHVMRRDEEYVGKRAMGRKVKKAGEEDRRRGGRTV